MYVVKFGLVDLDLVVFFAALAADVFFLDPAMVDDWLMYVFYGNSWWDGGDKGNAMREEIWLQFDWEKL